MTSPIPALPNVQYGNVAQDIGGAATGLIQGLLDQRVRAQQLALQQALGQANIQRSGAEVGLEQAQTQEAGQRAAQLQRGLEPAGHDQFLQLKHFLPDASEQELSGMTRAEADQYIQRSAEAWAMRQMQMELQRTRLSDDEESRLRTSYDRDSTHSVKLLDNYRNALQQYTQASTTNPYQAEGMLLSWLRQNTNRMNQAEISRISRLGGLDQLWQRHVNGEIFGQNPVNSQMLEYLRDAAAGVGQSIYQEYQANRQRYQSLATGRGIDPNFIVGPDNYQDIPTLEQQAGIRQTPNVGPTLGDLHQKLGY